MIEFIANSTEDGEFEACLFTDSNIKFLEKTWEELIESIETWCNKTYNMNEVDLIKVCYIV